MCLRINHVLLQVQQAGVIAEQQVQVLQRLAEKKGLHHVLGPDVGSVPDVADGRVAVRHLRVVLEALEDPPAPVLVGGVPGELVHVPQALDELGT